MKTVIIVYALTLILIFMITPAKSQYLNQSKIIQFHNNATGEKIGTATISGNTIYLRDKAGEHYATMVRNADGTRTLYDPHGKVIDADSLNLLQIPD